MNDRRGTPSYYCPLAHASVLLYTFSAIYVRCAFVSVERVRRDVFFFFIKKVTTQFPAHDIVIFLQ